MNSPIVRLRAVVAALAVATAACAAVATAGSFEAAAWHVRHWTSEDGLPQNNVEALAQTRDGYLWIGTWIGLARFDGVRFTVFHRLNTPAFASDAVNALAEDADGNLWIGTADGLIVHRDGHFRRFSTDDGLPNPKVWRLMPSRAGGVWMHVGGSAAHWRNGRPVVTVDLRLVVNQHVRSLHENEDGSLTIVTAFGLRHVTAQGELRETGAPPGVPAQTWPGAWPRDRQGRFWLSGHRGVWRHDGDWRLLHDQFWGEDIQHVMYEDRAGALWIHRGRGGLWRFSGASVQPVTLGARGAAESVRCFVEDREGHLWVGTRAGLFQLRPQWIRSFSAAEGLHPHCQSVCEGPDGAVWVETTRGVARIVGDRVETFADEPHRGQRHSVLMDREGAVWLGNRHDGVIVWTPGVKTNLFWSSGQPGTASGVTLDALYLDRAGRVWAGTSHGVTWFERGRPAAEWGRFGLPTNSVRAIYQTRDGTMWFGMNGHGAVRWRSADFQSAVSQVSNLRSVASGKAPESSERPADWKSAIRQTGSLRYNTADGLADNRVFVFHEDADGALWIGTHNGLSRFKDGRFFTFRTEHGLYDNLINWLEEDDFGRLWFSGNRGIFRIDRAELNEVAEGKKARARPIVHGTADGMLSPETNGEHQPAGCKTRDGRIWFPTAGGVVVIDPSLARSTGVAPVVVIEQVKADGELLRRAALQSRSVSPAPGAPHVPAPPPYPSTAALESRAPLLRLPAGRARDLQIRYTANSFLDPRRTRFQCRLVNHDAGWREETTERLAVFTNLRPGDYRFEVRAANAHGVWCEAPASFAFSLAPHFWQTWPFYALCGLAMLGLTGGFTAYRLRWQRRLLTARHEQALAEERARIARDLHDDLGTALTGVALEIDVARRMFRTEHVSGSAPLAESASRIRALAERMREVVWAVNPRCDTVSSLASFLEQQAGTLLRPGGVRVRFDFPEDIPALPLDSETRHQLALAVRETLTNVLRHSRAAEVVLGLALGEDAFIVSVQDDGRGFDAAGVGREAGHGLHNLRVRLERVGGVASIESSPGQGTRIELRVPLEGRQRKVSSDE